MIIANPIYDVVFKYLMEDLDIARGVLSTIIGQDIIELSIKPQETVSESNTIETPIKVYRLDFKAIVKTDDGVEQKILIELQKSKQFSDIMRFRKYLGDNYRKEDRVIINGKESIKPLPIITIYFLGFKLKNVETAVLKVNNCLIDAITGDQVTLPERENFIELLNHVSYTIQIPRLKYNLKTKLEKVLMVFSQDFVTDDKHKLDFEGVKDLKLIRKILNRLNRAIASEKMRRLMDYEDEIERIFSREMGVLNEELKATKQELEEKNQALEEKNQALEQKDQALEQNAQALEQKNQAIEALKKELEQFKNKNS